MKKKLLVAIALLTAGTSIGAAAEPPTRERAVMVYVSKSFGSALKRNRAPLAFGLKLQQADSYQGDLAFDLFDLRYAPGRRTTLTVASSLQLNIFDSEKDSSSSSSSSGPQLQDNPVLVVAGVAVIVAGGLCLAKKVICTQKKSYHEPTTQIPTGPPGG